MASSRVVNTCISKFDLLLMTDVYGVQIACMALLVSATPKREILL